MKNGYVLGIDLGTSSLKVNLVDQTGSVAAESCCDYQLRGVAQGRFEQQPQDWINAMICAVHQATKGVLPEEINGMALSAQMPTLVLLSPEGKPVGNAILWCDARADEEGAGFLKTVGAKRHYETTGVILDGRYLVPMYLWLKKNQQEDIGNNTRILSAKDYLYYVLTGKVATDPSTASGFGIYNLRQGIWDENLMTAAGIEERLLPKIISAYDCSAVLNPAMAEKMGLMANLPVYCGAADSVAGVVGVAGDSAGMVCGMCGSSTALIAVCDNVNTEAQQGCFITPMAKPQTYGLEADILSTGSTQQWLLDMLNAVALESGGTPFTFETLSQMAEKISAGAEGLFFTPYLMGGEQGVLWNPALSGGLFGLTSAHSINHIVRACVEGIGYEIKRCIEAFRAGGAKASHLVLSGPVTGDSVYMQIMADILGIPCCAAEVQNASAYGAALIALGQGNHSVKHREFLPQKEVGQRYEELYLTYKKVSERSHIK